MFNSLSGFFGTDRKDFARSFLDILYFNLYVGATTIALLIGKVIVSRLWQDTETPRQEREKRPEKGT